MKFFSKKLAFLFVGLFVLSACGKGCNRPGAKNDALSLIPASNNFLINVNVKKLNTTPFYQEATKDVPEEARAVLSTVDEAYLALNLKGPSEAPMGLAIVTGKFEEAKIVSLLEERAKKQGGELKKETLEGKTLYLSAKDPNIGLVFVSPTLAMWGQKVSIQESLALSTKKGASIESNKTLMDLFAQRDAQKMIWGAGVLPRPATASNPQNPDPMASLQGLEAFTFGIDFNKALTIDWVGNAHDTTQAQNIANLFNSYKTIFGASIAAQYPQWGQVIQSAQITNKDKTISLSLSIGEDLIQEIKQKIAEKKKALETQPAPAAESQAAPRA